MRVPFKLKINTPVNPVLENVHILLWYFQTFLFLSKDEQTEGKT